MKVAIVVKTNARKEGIEKLSDGTLRVSVNAPPREGRANEEVIRVLAQYFQVKQSAVRIIMGAGAKKKLVEVLI